MYTVKSQVKSEEIKSNVKLTNDLTRECSQKENKSKVQQR